MKNIYMHAAKYWSQLAKKTSDASLRQRYLERAKYCRHLMKCFSL